MYADSSIVSLILVSAMIVTRRVLGVDFALTFLWSLTVVLVRK